MNNNNYCSHYVLGECSQEHHKNCVGMARCIRDLEDENTKLKQKLLKYLPEDSEEQTENTKEQKEKEALNALTIGEVIVAFAISLFIFFANYIYYNCN